MIQIVVRLGMVPIAVLIVTSIVFYIAVNALLVILSMIELICKLAGITPIVIFAVVCKLAHRLTGETKYLVIANKLMELK